MSHGIVLIVDDDFDIRDTLGDILEDLGYRADFAVDGIEALSYLRSHPKPCVIFLDWMMPRCDGPGFRAAQLDDDRIADVPVVLMTAHAQIESRLQQLGTEDYLAKPVALESLAKLLTKYCKPMN